MRSILHVDMNNFYASVECLYHPEIRNFPVAVAGDPLNRHGIILAKNMIAKKLGVTTGEAIWEAKLKAPGLVLVPPDYKKYIRFSRMAREIYYEYSDQVEAFGLDENWIDLTGSLSCLHSDPVSIANTIRRRVKEELGVTVSVGVSFNKIFAKLGSDLKKPDATTVIPFEHFKEIVWPLPVGDLLYVGRSTARQLELIAVNTIGDLARTDVAILRRRLGKWGEILWFLGNPVVFRQRDGYVPGTEDQRKRADQKHRQRHYLSPGPADGTGCQAGIHGAGGIGGGAAAGLLREMPGHTDFFTG